MPLSSSTIKHLLRNAHVPLYPIPFQKHAKLLKAYKITIPKKIPKDRGQEQPCCNHDHDHHEHHTHSHKPQQPRKLISNTPPLSTSVTPTESIQTQVANADYTIQPTPYSSSTEVSDSPLARLLGSPVLVISRKLEWGTILVGFEQANQYTITNLEGNIVGYIAEDLGGVGKTIARNVLTTNRSFRATIFDHDGKIVYTVHRPFNVINSSMYVFNNTGEEVGRILQRFHVYRRKYDIYLYKNQIASIDMPILSWEFTLNDDKGAPLATIDRNWQNLPRELFTDSGQYVVRMDELANASRKLSLEERSIVLATAITIDYDYFSRHSGGGFLPIPFLFPPAPIPPTPTDTPIPSPTSDVPTTQNTPTPDPTMQTQSQTPPQTQSENSEELRDEWGQNSTVNNSNASSGVDNNSSFGNDSFGSGDPYDTTNPEIMQDPWDKPTGSTGGEGGDGEGGVLKKLWDFFNDD
eukprot:TRINITY_DN2859_c0_g1_i6.p1 TRINITY_DN2859_c0_g1~~TRINITY_DN2859_c0_g1_i6.p1  ORF type:complete len:465 (+),score=97.80 TRINITY_DN2859_c0_g1_i6:436-1830(+)